MLSPHPPIIVKVPPTDDRTDRLLKEIHEDLQSKITQILESREIQDRQSTPELNEHEYEKLKKSAETHLRESSESSYEYEDSYSEEKPRHKHISESLKRHVIMSLSQAEIYELLQPELEEYKHQILIDMKLRQRQSAVQARQWENPQEQSRERRDYELRLRLLQNKQQSDQAALKNRIAELQR